jgi:branched-chain amino acid transport system substrate-binding protein
MNGHQRHEWKDEGKLLRELLDREASRRSFLAKGALVLGSSAVLAELVAACGGTATRSSSAGSSSVVTVGAPLPLTGAWSEEGQNCLKGLTLGVEDVNNAGGIKAMGGAKLKVAPADTSSDDPAQAADSVRRLVEGGATALVGSYLSSLTLTSSTAAEQARVPMISQSFVDQLTQRGYKYYFQLPPKSSTFGNASADGIVAMAKDAGLRLETAAVIGSDDASSKAQSAAVADRSKALGIQVLVNELYPPSIADMSPLVSKVRAAKPDIVFFAGPVQPTVLFVRTLRSLGDRTPVNGIGGGGILDVSFPQSLGSASDGVFALCAWSWDLRLPGVPSVVKRYNARYKVPFMPQEAGESYVAAWIIAAALERAKANDPQKIRDAIANLSFTGNDRVAELWPGRRLKFDATGLATNYPLTVEYKGGKPHIVWPKGDQTMKPFFS